MLGVLVARGKALQVAFMVADDNTILAGIELEDFREVGEQGDGCLVCLLDLNQRFPAVDAFKMEIVSIAKAIRFAHLDANMRVVQWAPAVPASHVPGQRLENVPVFGVDESMNACSVEVRMVPILQERRGMWLRTSDGMQHESLDGYFASGEKAGIPG